MARMARADGDGGGGGGGGAARLAARRRPAPKSFDKSSGGGSSKKTPAKGVKGKARSGGSPGGGVVKKTAKLVLLVGAMICIGFFAVLVVDVAASLVGKVKLGETSVVEVWQKMVDRVLDRDVPRSPTPTTTTPAPAPRPARPSRAVADRSDHGERAPLPVARTPEEDARHVAPSTKNDAADPQVQRAKQRLDDLLGRL